MNNNYINFKQKRDLGTTISDTFGFIRNEYKTIFRLYFRHVGIVLLLLVAATTYSQYQSLSLTSNAQLGNDINVLQEYLPNFGIALIAMIVLSILYYALSFCTISGIIKSYVNNNGKINDDEVRNTVNQNYLKISGIVLLIGLILGIGFMLCFLPGIYLMIPFSLVIYIMIFQNKGFSDAVSESFQLIKNNWWITFATLLVIGILISVISSVFQLPAMILTGIETFTAIESGDSSMFKETGVRLLYLVFSVIANLAQHILSLVTIIAISFIYFNLNEVHNKTGTLEDIDQIGNS
ncbi:MAG: glycerophosphoryl diester phosphodiesterase membrane domain-containing protein [Psychroflexus sp.]